jgi:conjugative relaxase-like TrwC/TraI family protein
VVAVISVAMLSGGTSGGYYLDRGADCGAEYYTDERETAGCWCGSGAAAAGLTGAVEGAAREVFAGLLAGRLPDGTQVGRPVLRADPRGLLPARLLVDAVRVQAAGHGLEPAAVFLDPTARAAFIALAAEVDASTRRAEVSVDARTAGELAAAAGLDPHLIYTTGGADRYTAALPHARGKVDRRRAGIDLTVSPPKSVSLLHAFGNAHVRGQVRAAHDTAVGHALAYLETHTAHGMRGHQGHGQRATRISTRGFVAAGFTHLTSRADDPQLHTHLVIANLVRGVDGAWSAVDSWAVFRQARTAGAVYQASLRGELTRRLGVAWEPVHQSVAEISGIPQPVLRAFSTRRRHIERECQQAGAESRAARQRAAYLTRPAKSHTSTAELRAGWQERLHDQGHEPDRLVAGAVDRAVPPALPDVEVLAERLFGPDGVTARQTSFIRRELTRALADTLPTGAPVTADLLEGLTDRLLTHPAAIPLLTPAAGGEWQWTTADLLATEQRALTHAGRMLSAPLPAAELVSRTVAATGADLSRGQRRAVVNLAFTAWAVQVLIGPAGSGKTTVLATAAACWQADGRPVLGAALAAATAERLQTASGIPSASLARLLASADRPDPATGRARGLPAAVVVVVDEASMVGTRQLTRLLDHVAAANGQTILVGDPAQLPEVEAGGLFAALAADPLRSHVLHGNARQHHDWERDALAALRDGSIDEALDAYLDNDRIHVLDSPAELSWRMAVDYTTSRAAHGPYGVVALASRRADVHRLNQSIRGRLQADGTIGPDTVSVHGGDRQPIPLAAGDLVMVTRNDPATGLFNGTRAQLTTADPHVLGLRTEDGRAFTVPTGWASGRLVHAYALTVHKAQGLTTTDCLLYGTGALCQQAGYVALSRGREANHLYTTLSGLDADRSPDQPGFQLLGGPDPAYVLDALADRLTRAHAHTLASQQQPAFTDEWLHRIVLEPPARGYGIER